jgi:hypothetical protein
VDDHVPFLEVGQQLDPEERQQGERNQEEQRGHRHDGAGPAEEPDQRPAVRVLEPPHQRPFLAVGGGSGQEQGGESRRQGEGDQQRGKGGGDVGIPERSEKSSLDAAEKEDRKENERHDERGVDDGAADFQRRFEDDAEDRQRLREPAILPKSPEDVLHVDDGVVHHLPDGDRQSSQRHGVQGRPGAAQDEDRREQGDGNRGEADGRGPEVHEEQNQDDGHQDGSEPESALEVSHRPLDERGLPEQLLVNADALRESMGKLFQSALQGSGHFQRVGARKLVDFEDDPRTSVDGGIPDLELRSEADLGHLPQRDGNAVAIKDDRLLQIRRRAHQPLGANRQHLIAGAQEAGRGQGRSARGGGDHLADADSVSLQAPGGDENLVLLDAPSEDGDAGDARNRQDPRPQGPVGETPQLQRIESGSRGEADVENRARSGNDGRHSRSFDPGGQARRRRRRRSLRTWRAR